MFLGMDIISRTVPAVGPHAEAGWARLIEEDGPVYILIGALLQEDGATEDDPFELLVAPGITREFDAFFLPMMQFFRTSRTEQHALEWLAWAGAPDDALNDLVSTGVVVRVDTTNPLAAAKSLKGVRVIPQSMPGEPEPDLPTQISVRRGPDSPIESYVSIELEHVLWGLDKPLDIPAAIKQMARQARERRDLTARRVITHIPDLVRLGLARLEWVDACAAAH
jgi:hypothetical protein